MYTDVYYVCTISHAFYAGILCVFKFTCICTQAYSCTTTSLRCRWLWEVGASQWEVHKLKDFSPPLLEPGASLQPDAPPSSRSFSLSSFFACNSKFFTHLPHLSYLRFSTDLWDKSNFLASVDISMWNHPLPACIQGGFYFPCFWNMLELNSADFYFACFWVELGWLPVTWAAWRPG